MAEHKLVPYWIRLRESGETDDYWDLTEIHESEPNYPVDNLADLFYDFCEDWYGEVDIDEEKGKTFTVSDLYQDGNTIEGQMKSGDYGLNADFFDVEEHERIEDAREANHSQEIPYYFFFHILDGEPTRALLIVRQFKNYGVVTRIRERLTPKAQADPTGCQPYIEINPHYSHNVQETLEEADTVSSVKLRGRRVLSSPEELAADAELENPDTDVDATLSVNTEYTLRPRDNEGLFKRFAKGLRPNSDVPEFDYGEIINEDIAEANVTIKEGESQLTFSLFKEKIVTRMDVDPEEYDLEVYGGHPTPYTLGQVARQLANDLTNEYDTEVEEESIVPEEIGRPDDESDDDGNEEEAPVRG